MRAEERRLAAAVEKVRRKLSGVEWVRGVGVGLVDRLPGIVISVRPDAARRARVVLGELEVGVPVKVRAVGPVRKRAASPASGARRAPKGAGAR
jgi:hypothetical protein